MNSSPDPVPDNPEAVPADSGLRCPQCEYNLTGLTENRCPECGSAVNWAAALQARDVEAKRPGTYWERWPWRLKPLGFVVTTVQVALLPWAFARQLPSKPRRVFPLAFLGVCMLAGALVAVHASNADKRSISMWGVGVASHALVQTLVFGLILPLPHMNRPFRFWLTVTCYTSYPLLLEGFDAPPYILPFHKEGNIWPFPLFWHGNTATLTSILYYVWWIGLAIIAFVRLAPRHRRRVVLVVLAVFAMTVVSSYTGCQVGGYIGEHVL